MIINSEQNRLFCRNQFTLLLKVQGWCTKSNCYSCRAAAATVTEATLTEAANSGVSTFGFKLNIIVTILNVFCRDVP